MKIASFILFPWKGNHFHGENSLRYLASGASSRTTLIALGAGVILLACATNSAPLPMPGDTLGRTATLFRDHCAPCHGSSGQGDGPMAPYLETRPRSFRNESFRFISNSLSTTPAAGDIARFVRTGSRASHMPSHAHLPPCDVEALAEYVLEVRRLGMIEEITTAFADENLSPEEVRTIVSEQLELGSSLTVPLRPPGFRTDVARGATLFAANCATCHGPQGLGDGTEELLDELGRPIQPRNLNKGDYRGGSSDRDLFRRLRCGLPGTPMPALEVGVVSDEELWQLIDYLRVLAGGR